MVTNEVFLKGVNDLISALKLIDDTQVDIREELAEMNEQLENISNHLEGLLETSDAINGILMDRIERINPDNV